MGLDHTNMKIELSMKRLFLILGINLILGFQVTGQPDGGISANNTDVPEENLRVLLNVDTVLNAYISAIGGWEKLSLLKDMTLVNEKFVEGKKIVNLTSQVNAPEGVFFIIRAYENGLEQYRVLCEKNKFTMWKGSSKQILEGEQATRIYEQSFLLIEPAYPMLGIRPELLGVEKVEGQYTYKIKAIFGDTNIYSYYDCRNGLKVKVDVEMRNNHKFSFIDDYRKTDIGLLYAYTMRRLDGISTISRVEVNQGLKLEDFQ